MADNTSADTLEASSQSQDTKSAGGEQSSSTHGGAGTDPTPASRDDTNTGLTNSGGVDTSSDDLPPAVEAAADAPDFMGTKPGSGSSWNLLS